MSTPNREDFESEDGFYGVGVERTADGLRLSAGTRNRDASAILSPAKAREFAHAVLRQADAVEGVAASQDARVMLLARQVVDALNNCDHCGNGSPTACGGCEPMLAALREAGVEVERVAGEVHWPIWRLKP